MCISVIYIMNIKINPIADIDFFVVQGCSKFYSSCYLFCCTNEIFLTSVDEMLKCFCKSK